MLLGNGFGFWKTMPIRRRSATASVSGELMSWPSNRRSPSIRQPGIRSFMRLKQRSSVLLPQPEGPIKAVIRFRGISISTDFRASADPYQTERPCAERTGGTVAGADPARSEGMGATDVSGKLMASASNGAAVPVPDHDGRGVHREQE